MRRQHHHHYVALLPGYHPAQPVQGAYRKVLEYGIIIYAADAKYASK